jgi:hypothetical protein
MSKNQKIPRKTTGTEDGFSQSAVDTFANDTGGARLGAAPSGSRERVEVEKDAPPSNTASNKCNSVSFMPLRWGVDSLYLSYSGTLDEGTDYRLRKLKEVARSAFPHEQANAQYQVDEHIFEVQDKGSGLFPYVIKDGAFRIALSRSKAKSLPMAYVQISSNFLSARTPQDAEDHLRKILQQLGTLSAPANVSRIDMFVDFVSDVDMESWNRHAWVTRAHAVNQYAVQGNFSGWAIGLGGVIACRLYDKTLEIQESGKDYLKELWSSAGWKEGQRVWRLEFEIKRDLLSQIKLATFSDVMGHLSGLWSYATDDWLRLCLPDGNDKTRSRWAIHPLWQYLASVDWEGDGGKLLSRFSPTRAPDDKYLFGRALSLIISFMARDGHSDYDDAGDKMLSWIRSYTENHICMAEGVSFDQYVAEQIAIKSRAFNTALNKSGEAWDQEEQAKAAKAYLKASKG